MHVSLGNRQAKADQAEPYLTAWATEFRKGRDILLRWREKGKIKAFKKAVQRDPITAQGWQLYKQLRDIFEKEENLDS